MSDLITEVYAILNQSNISLRAKRERQRNIKKEHDGSKSQYIATDKYQTVQSEIDEEADRALKKAVALCKKSDSEDAEEVLNALKIYAKHISTHRAERVLNGIFSKFIKE